MGRVITSESLPVLSDDDSFVRMSNCIKISFEDCYLVSIKKYLDIIQKRNALKSLVEFSDTLADILTL